MNKMDLADERVTKNIVKQYIKNEYTKVVYSNCSKNTDKGIRQVLKSMKDLLKHDHLEDDVEAVDRTVKALVCGIPNVGKSSFINAARHRYTQRSSKATAVGKRPGVTRSVLSNIIISESPKVMILDTPGIIPPQISDPITGIKLAAVGTFADHVIGEEVIADYLLYAMNKQNNQGYLDMCGLNEPTDDFDSVISSISQKYELTRRGKPCYRRCSIKMVAAFRKNQFGRMTLDV